MSSPSCPHPNCEAELQTDHELDLTSTATLGGSILTMEDELADVPENAFSDIHIDVDHEEADRDQIADRLPGQYHLRTTSSPPSSHRLHTSSFLQLNEDGLAKWRSRLDVLRRSQPSTSSEPGNASDSATSALFKHAAGLYDWLMQSVIPYIHAIEGYNKTLQHEKEDLNKHLELLQEEAEQLLEAYTIEYETSRSKTALLAEIVDWMADIAERKRGEDQEQI